MIGFFFKEIYRKPIWGKIMAHITYKCKDINDVIKFLEDYKTKRLPNKTNEFVKKLASEGIELAKQHNKHVSGPLGTHYMEELVTFSMEVSKDVFGVSGKIIGEGKMFVSTWDNGTQSEDVLPLHYLEFGTSKNGSMKWSFVDNDGTIFDHATGIKPTRPMYNAYMDLYTKVNAIAMEVWST